jgi:hypothetical protein
VQMCVVRHREFHHPVTTTLRVTKCFRLRSTFDIDNIDIGPERRQFLDHRLSRVWEMNAEVGTPRAPSFFWEEKGFVRKATERRTTKEPSATRWAKSRTRRYGSSCSVDALFDVMLMTAARQSLLPPCKKSHRMSLMV